MRAWRIGSVVALEVRPRAAAGSDDLLLRAPHAHDSNVLTRQVTP